MKSGCRKEKSKTHLNSADCPQDRAGSVSSQGTPFSPVFTLFSKVLQGWWLDRWHPSLPAAASAISLRSLPLRIPRAGAAKGRERRAAGWAPGPRPLRSGLPGSSGPSSQTRCGGQPLQ